MVHFDTYRSHLGRLYFLQFIVIFLCILLGIAIVWRQWIENGMYSQLGQKQCLRRILYPGTRGCIYDKTGELLATNRDIYCLYVDLNYFRKDMTQFNRQSKDAETQSEQLWAIVHDALLPYAKTIGPIPFSVSKKTLYRHYLQNILLPLSIAKDLPEAMYAKFVEQLPTHGPFQVGIEKVRYYPYGSVACHVIGHVTQTSQLTQDALPGNDLRTFFLPKQKGATGIEAYYDDQLSGLNGGDIWRVTPSGQEQACLISLPSVDGNDLHLTLDIQLQQMCEQALGNRRGAIVILAVDSGEVLALVSKPDFDLNALTPRISEKLFQKITAQGAWLNRAIQGLYPPGSTFKIITLAALLQAGVVNAQSSVNCTGSYTIGNHVFHCHNRQGHGYIALDKAVQTSCNPFFYHYALRCGPSLIYKEAWKLGLGDRTHIDLPYETRNMLVPSPIWKKKRLRESWTDGDTANFSIGQGFLRVTPLQMACAAASLAKNKRCLTPHLCSNFVCAEHSQEAIMAHDHWRLLLECLEKAVESGTSRFSRVQGLKSAVKTGTSQVKIAGTNRYAHVGWLIGFAPSQQPKIAFSVVIEQEDLIEEFWGSRVCGPIAQKFLQFCLDQGKI
ncbi:MAG: hypothetical protein LBJ78_01650 [Puniceicoccales bacterium]|nr:hypothetical protein [Puniceicoccales bacterium]